MKKTLIILWTAILISGCMKKEMNEWSQVYDWSTNGTWWTVAVSATTYSQEDVATHSTKEDCRTIVNDNVYDVTAYAPRHPGGPEKIYAICGKDGSSLFENKHGGQPKPEMMLKKLLKGALKK